jgi:hypothetical protein
MKLLVLVPLMVWCARAAEPCPAGPGVGGSMQFWSSSVKQGPKHCVANVVEARDTVEWPAAGIEHAEVGERLEVAVCCYRHESAQPEKLRIGEREFTVVTHREDPKAAGKEDDDDFPDLIEDDAHGREVAIRGTLSDRGKPVQVNVLLRCTASKFADQYAFQFTVVNRSEKGVDLDWDHLRQVRAGSSPNVQPVAGGMAYVFLTAKRPREAIATVEVTLGGRVLGRFQFDGFTLVQ